MPSVPEGRLGVKNILRYDTPCAVPLFLQSAPQDRTRLRAVAVFPMNLTLNPRSFQLLFQNIFN